MLARLRGMMQALNAPEEAETAPAAPVAPAVPEANAEDVPLAAPAGPATEAEAPPPAEEAEARTAEETAVPLLCPACDSPRSRERPYCESCGYFFPPDLPAAPEAAAPVNSSGGRVGGRYELLEQVSERLGVARFRALDHGVEGRPAPVVVLRAALPPAATVEEAPAGPADDEVLPGFDVPAPPTELPTTAPELAPPAWPAITWERGLLEAVGHPALPAVLDYFTEGGYEYLVEELPTGASLWDAWDDPEADCRRRFGYLKQVAEGLHRLHQAGVILEGLRPDIVVVTPEGQARIADLSDLLPLPVPADAPIRATPYTAPELVGGGPADARADLYGFGAMLYALHVGRELTDNDFDKKTRAPKPFIPFFPDAHPLFARLMTKTFVREVALRFPTDEAAREDPTGFTELIRTLEACGRVLDNVRLEIAAWTTIGMVRTDNEDAFALLHAVESRQDDTGECALVLLADGMGGYEAGEVAAALAIQTLRQNLLQHKPFQMLAGHSPFAALPGKDAEPPAPVNVEEVKQLILAALKEANQAVYQAPRQGVGRRGMGCTAEVVYVDGRTVVVGHVGDSRTYHLHEGRLVQLTRDQTLVNRLVELGQLTPEEAEDHPRKNELQQAIGGQPVVDPGLYHGRMSPGDWVIVCSDGLSNHVKPEELKEMLQGEAFSAETAARRLINLVNLKGATDNATVVVIRAT
jgi:serine/threonine protein phosphatase PrpC